MQPGQTVSPGGAPENPTWQFNPDSQLPQAQPPAPQPVGPAPADTLPPDSIQARPTAASTGDTNTVSWTASEFIAHTKSGGWYALLVIVGLALAAGVFVLTKDKVSPSVIVIVVILFAISAARKPRELQYQVNSTGVNIGDKTYPYASFRSFSVIQEDGVESIWFMPLKRFRPIISIYFDPNDGDEIIEILSQNLPFEDHAVDAVDRLMHRIRF